VQDIAGHLQGGIPVRDVDALASYWAVCPRLRSALFRKLRPGYLVLAADKAALKATIFGHPEFTAFITGMNAHFNAWRAKAVKFLKALTPGCHPKEVIADLSEGLLNHYHGQPLIDAYDIYQQLMDYWAESMQDDCYLIAADGWKAETYRVIETRPGKGDKPGKQVDRGWACDLVPKPLIVARYFPGDQAALDEMNASLETLSARITEMEEEHGGEEGAFAEFDKVTLAAVKARLKELGREGGSLGEDEAAVLLKYLDACTEEGALKKQIAAKEAELDEKAYAKYPKLKEAEVKTLVVEDKWLAALDARIHGEMDRVSQQLSARVRELADRYDAPLPMLTDRVAELEAKVNGHLERMGFSW
jgi:type I restriction enzyme M protein